MKRIIAIVILTALLALAACAQSRSPVRALSEGEAVRISNPWHEITEAEANQIYPETFTVPDGAENAVWSVMDATTGALLQLAFDWNGLSFTAREQRTEEKDYDPSGMYYNWTVQEPAVLSDGTECMTFRYIGENESADLCIWYDAESGISRSVGVTAEDLDGFDLLAVAEALMMPKTLSAERQRGILKENRALWAFDTEGYSPEWFYTFCDLDHNGLMEVLSASTQGSGIYTYARFYEVLPDGSGVRNLYHADTETEGPDDWPEIIRETVPCYHDYAADRYYYVCENDLRDGASHGMTQVCALSLKDGTAEWECLAAMDVMLTDAGEQKTFTDGKGEAIREQEYLNAAERRFAGMERSEWKPDWIAGSQEAEVAEGNLSAYDGVIRSYRAAYETGNNTAEYAFSNGLSEYIAGSRRVCYACTDIDGDGIAELLIADPDNGNEQILFALYTLSDGSPIPLAVSAARSRYYLLNDGSVLWEASSGAAYSYVFLLRKSGAELSGTEGMITAPDGEEGIRIYLQNGSIAFDPRPEDREISDEEFLHRWEEYRNGICLPPMTPIL